MRIAVNWFVLIAVSLVAGLALSWAIGGSSLDEIPSQIYEARDRLIMLTLSFGAVILAGSVHEAAHALTALRFGDNTAQLLGRLTLKPWVHVDSWGTFLIPMLLIAFGSPIVLGFLRPVPVRFESLRPYRLGRAMVALAGPASNFVFAGFLYVVLASFGIGKDAVFAPDLSSSDGVLGTFAFLLLFVNVALGVFNMIPLPPFDGGHVILSMLPARWRKWIDDHYMKVSLGVIAMVSVVLYMLS